MPPRKRTNWRHPVVYDGELTGRRTTRAGRAGAAAAAAAAASSTGAYSSQPSFGSGGGSGVGGGRYSGGSSRRGGDRDGGGVNISRSNKRPRSWVEVHRPPAANIRFSVPVWIPQEELTPLEREKYLPPKKEEEEIEEDDDESGGDTDDQAVPLVLDPMEVESNVSAPMELKKPPPESVPGSIHKEKLSLVVTATPTDAIQNNFVKIEEMPSEKLAMDPFVAGGCCIKPVDPKPADEPSKTELATIKAEQGCDSGVKPFDSLVDSKQVTNVEIAAALRVGLDNAGTEDKTKVSNETEPSHSDASDDANRQPKDVIGTATETETLAKLDATAPGALDAANVAADTVAVNNEPEQQTETTVEDVAEVACGNEPPAKRQRQH